MSPIRGTPARALRAMTSSELTARLTEVKGRLRDLKNFALGQPRWWKSVPEVRAVRNCYRNEMHRIETILKERERVQNSTTPKCGIHVPPSAHASVHVDSEPYREVLP